MRTLLIASIAALAASSLGPSDASAQGYGRATRAPAGRDVDSTGSLGGRAPWNGAHEYDSGSDNDRRPALPYYQQGRGHQTGGPNRNLLPYDGFTLTPR